VTGCVGHGQTRPGLPASLACPPDPTSKACRWRKPAAGASAFHNTRNSHCRWNWFLSHLLDRTNLPELEPFVRFDFPTICHVYEINGQPLIEMAGFQQMRRPRVSNQVR
jgi:hypothetical protein